jgi:hypothetical protein
MAQLSLRFFSPADNQPTPEKSKSVSPKLTGSISATGKLVFSPSTIEQLAIEPDSTRFLIGRDPGKRKLKALYLVPTSPEDTNGFALQKGAKRYTIPLAFILQKGGIDYGAAKHLFTLSSFEYQPGIAGYELILNNTAPKPPYTGKPRGRKPKEATPM